MVPGETLFDLKAEKGLPLDFSLAVILDRGFRVEFPSFIQKARACGWYDFQTIKAIQEAMTDACIDRVYAAGVIERAKLFMLKHPFDEVFVQQ